MRLRGITVVFRHGERFVTHKLFLENTLSFRSPVSKVDDDTGCLPNRDIDRKAFVAYKELAKSDELLSFLKLDPALTQFPRIPLE